MSYYFPTCQRLKKYNDKRIYIERFSAAPPEPFYRIGDEAFLTRAVKDLKERIIANVFASPAEEVFIKDLERHYTKCFSWFKRATEKVNTIHLKITCND